MLKNDIAALFLYGIQQQCRHFAEGQEVHTEEDTVRLDIRPVQ
jgi:hypothetical protein